MALSTKGALLVVFAAMLALAGCGVRGSVEAPPGATADAGGPPAAPGEPKPHDSFVLDRLIR